MSFGKRRQEAARQPQYSSGASESSTPLQRIAALRDDIAGLLAVASRLADAVRSEASVPMPVILDDPDPAAGPFVLKGFHAHFVRLEAGEALHSVFAYRQQAGNEGVDPNAQYHLHQLTGRAMELNLFCQRAQLDEALGVALQSAQVPAMIDHVLVSAAFFTAFFDNMAVEMQRKADGARVPDLSAQRENLDRYLMMASDKMLDPGQLQRLLPAKNWPLFATEIEIAPHSGDYFINGVYFPADHARMLLGDRAQTSSVAA